MAAKHLKTREGALRFLANFRFMVLQKPFCQLCPNRKLLMHLISAMHPFLLTISSFLTAAVAVWGPQKGKEQF